MLAKEFTKLCMEAKDGSVIKLDKAERFDVWSDDTLVVEGYHFSNTASMEENGKGIRPVFLYMKDKKNVVVDGNGSVVYIHGIMTPFIFDNCENITFKNFIIDYAHPTMSEFTIEKSLGDGYYLIRIAKDSLYDIVDGEIIWHGEKDKNGQYYWQYNYREYMSISMHRDPVTEFTQMMGIDDTHNRFPCVPEFLSIEEVGERLYKVRLKIKDDFFPVGSTVQTRNTVREQIGGAFLNCTNALCENVTVHAMHGLGLLGQYCDNLTFRGMNITPAEGRTIASNADFFQISGCKGLVTIENCVCAEGHDDFINAHGTHLRVIEADGKYMKVRFMEAHSRGFCAFFVGNEIDVINAKTLLPYASGVVASVVQCNDTDFDLQLTEEIDAKVGDVVENVTYTPELLIRNNRFGPSTGRGVLCTTRRRVRIENNVFYKTGGNALCIEDDCNFWFESGFTTDVIFRNNEVVECGYGSLGRGEVPIISINPQVLEKSEPVYVHKRIEISDNKFTLLQSAPVVLNNKPQPRRDAPAIVDVKYTENFIFQNNQVDKEVTICPVSVKNIKL